MPSFEQFKTLLKELLTLESLKTTEGTLGFDAIIAFSKEKLAELRQAIIDAKIKETLANIYGGEETANVDPLQNLNDLADQFEKTSKKFRDTIARGLEKPFRDFFDTLLEEGKINLDSFVDLFKDMIKRIAAQLISAGIAKLLTSILMPQAAVGGALAGAASGSGGPTGILKFLVGLFGGGKSLNDINFAGVQKGGMEMAGQVVFTQRGSDLVGVLNRTNGTINRVG
jgi:polyhydroxyalkanoate synthesis regulator phasin